MSHTSSIPIHKLHEASCLQMVECAILCSAPNLPQPSLELLTKLRGALGHVLWASASKAAREGRPCSFEPQSLYHLFHNHPGRSARGGELPKPFVLCADPAPDGMIFSLRLFGPACDRAPEFLSAWVAAARRGVARSRIETLQFEVLHALAAPQRLPSPAMLELPVTLTTRTPVIQRNRKAPGKIDLVSLLKGIAVRAAGLAERAGATLQIDEAALEAQVLACLDAVEVQGSVDLHHLGKKRRHGFSGTISLPPVAPPLSTLLQWAPWLHIGADTAHGAGRVSISV